MADRETGTLDEIVFRGKTALDQREFEVLMEQYKLFVDTSERLVARRQVVNTFFLSVNTLALSAVGLVAKEVQTSPLVAIGVVAISIAAIVLCVAWKTLVRSYAQLNRGKFAVIDCLEDRLPAALFRAEWAALGAGKDPKSYKPFTHTEAVVSNIFMVIYGLAALLTVAWLIGSCL
jgi:hypothetical protein